MISTQCLGNTQKDKNEKISLAFIYYVNEHVTPKIVIKAAVDEFLRFCYVVLEILFALIV